MTEQEKFMKEALKEAKKALSKEEVPVGAVIVEEGKIIARGHNIKEAKQSALKHAEIVAIDKASKKKNNWRLSNCDLYVTLEPCNMCTGAILQSRIRKIYIGTMDEQYGYCGSVLNLPKDYNIGIEPEIESGILEEECREILKSFFKVLRNKNKKQ